MMRYIELSRKELEVAVCFLRNNNNKMCVLIVWSVTDTEFKGMMYIPYYRFQLP